MKVSFLQHVHDTRNAKLCLGLMGTVEEQRQSIDSLGSQLRNKSQKLSQTQDLYNKIKRQKLLDQIDYTNSQVVEPDMEPVSGPAPTFIAPRPAKQSMYPPGTVMSPAYPNTQLSPRYSLGVQAPHHMAPLMQGGTSSQHSNTYALAQPAQATSDRRGQHEGKHETDSNIVS